jgi:hypothetical protein
VPTISKNQLCYCLRFRSGALTLLLGEGIEVHVSSNFDIASRASRARSASRV